MQASRRSWLFITLAVLCGMAPAFGQITPLADSYTNTAASTTNYGAKPTINVDGATEISYIQFDLSGIPAGATVSKAMLKLYVGTVAIAGSFNVDYVNGLWTESTLDASNAPALGGNIASNVAISAASKNQYIQVDVTSAVEAWLSGSQANDGLALVANSTTNVAFNSKESTTTSHSPELDIVYAEGITGVTTASGSGLTGGGTSGTLSLGLTTSCSSNQVLQWSGNAWACAAVGSGTITGVAAGTALTGGGTSGAVTLNVDTTQVPLLGAANVFNNSQTVNGNLSATGVVTGSAFQIGSNLFSFGSYSLSNAFSGFAGNTSMTGNFNTGNGAFALVNNSSGASNTATGAYALGVNTTGIGNTAHGVNALGSDSTGGGNTAMGYAALGATTGNNDTVVGSDAMDEAVTGSGNTSLGAFAGNTADQSVLSGGSNTLLGQQAWLSTGTLGNATAIGANAEVARSNALVLGSVSGVNGATSGVNVGIGTTSPLYTLDVHGTGNFTGPITFASGQTFPGTGTITSVTAGSGLSGGGSSGAITLTNTGVLGLTSGTGITVGTGQNPGVGINTAVVPQLSVANTFTGNQTVNGNLSATGVLTGSGFQIGSSLFDYGSYANQNAFSGFGGNASMTGVSNTAVGYLALQNNKTGSDNVAIGSQAEQQNQGGAANTAIGQLALEFNLNGSNNTAVGNGTLFLTSGGGNTAVGLNAGGTSDASYLSGNFNTFLGIYSSASTGTVQNATAIGAEAVVAESNALVLGSVNGVNGANASVNVGIGTTTPATTLDVEGNAAATTAPTLWLRNNAGIQTGATGNSVDIRFNPDGGGTVSAPNAYIRASENGSDQYGTFMSFGTIAQGGSTAAERVRITSTGSVGIGTTAPDSLLTVNGSADKPGGGSWATFSDRRLKDLDGSFSAGLPEILKINPVKYRYKQDNGMGISDHGEHIGVVAQEIKEAIPEAVTQNSKGFLMVNNDPVIWAMLNAIKEQQRQIKDQTDEITKLRAQLKQRAAMDAALETRLAKLEKGNDKNSTRSVSAEIAIAAPRR